ncbi:ABC transporter ATP-binding protein/permease [Halobacillus litoralis]|uniref:ABC transporter ATP-binding protein n=1 Tax=Halobacillus litoralis TaxID=45668 RepID=UPI001CD57116|nr:ABC transporter ATP-binding protein [Halobacillus litoralis]MCA0971252.1 ABC transporter ATP-binding protein/permease [Halobacillus litoralis]
MRRLFTYSLSYKWSAIIALALMGIELVVELVQPLLMAKIVDEGIVAGDFSVVSGWGAVLVGLSLLAFAAGVTNSFFAARLSQGVGYDLRRDLFEKVQSFTSRNFQSYSTPGLITRITNDVVQIQNLLFMFVRIALRAPLFIVFALFMAFTIDVQLSLILIVAVPLFLAFLFFILSKGVRLFSRVQQKVDRVNTVIRENLTGIRLIKGFNRGKHEEERFRGVNDDLMDKNKRALWLMEVAMPVVMLGMNIIILVVLWMSVDRLAANSIQPGEVVAIVNYATRIMFTFSIFTFLIMVFSRGNASANRITDVLDEETPSYLHEKKGESPVLKGKVSFEDVSFRHGEMTTLDSISFQAEAGRTIGILGETGSGKTSLLHLIPRLYEKTSGAIYLDHHPIEALDVKSLRQQISLVPQEIHLFSGTVKENIAWGKEEASDAEIREAAEQAQIHEFITTLPNGYETRLGQKGVTFSGGQKQRLSIARALVRKPKILILDDSTSALDAHTEHRLMEALREQSCTVFMVAQKISSLKAAHDILVLHKGKLIAEGPHEQLLKESDYYREVYQSQLEEVQ